MFQSQNEAYENEMPGVYASKTPSFSLYILFPKAIARDKTMSTSLNVIGLVQNRKTPFIKTTRREA